VRGAQDWWSGFDRDPRLAANRGLRASDRDRDVVRQLLTEAFADGRLDRAVFDERSDRVDASRTLGELPDLVGDLMPVQPSPPVPRGLMGPEQLRQRAVEDWRSERREAAWGLVAVSAIVWVIWGVTGMGFPWPVFVTLAAALNLAQIQFMREQKIHEKQRRLERKQTKELRTRREDQEGEEA
jgi:hypothetical protein